MAKPNGNPPPRAAITGVILAGGLGRRMGRVDKGLQPLDGKPLVQWVAERLAPQVGQLLVNANRNAAAYGKLGYSVIGDLVPGFAGPLAGLHAALTYASHPLVAAVPCDSPFLPADLVTRLHAAMADSDVATVRTFDQPQPAFCLCRRELLPQLAAFLAKGEHAMALWYRTLRIVHVPFDDEADAFRNINTTAELARWAHHRI